MRIKKLRIKQKEREREGKDRGRDIRPIHWPVPRQTAGALSHTEYMRIMTTDLIGDTI